MQAHTDVQALYQSAYTSCQLGAGVKGPSTPRARVIRLLYFLTITSFTHVLTFRSFVSVPAAMSFDGLIITAIPHDVTGLLKPLCSDPVSMQGVVTFDGLIITANSSMNTTGAYGLNYTITFSAASTSGITSWDVPVNIRYTQYQYCSGKTPFFVHGGWVCAGQALPSCVAHHEHLFQVAQPYIS